MGAYMFTWFFLFSMLATSYCNDGIGVMHRRMRRLNRKLSNFKTELVQMKTNLQDSIDKAKESIRLELTQHIKQQIDEAMAGFREHGSVQNVGSLRVDSDILILKQGHEDMERQLDSVMETLRDLNQERDKYRDTPVHPGNSGTDSCSQCGRYAKLLENVLKHCNRFDVKGNFEDDPTDKASSNLTLVLEKLSLTCKDEIEKPSSTPISTTTTTTTTTTNKQTPTTPTPVQQPPFMNRLIVAPFANSGLSQINLQSNTMSRYPLTVSDGVSSLCFVHRLRRLLVGTYDRDRITSTLLDGDDTRTLRQNVGARGMSVDEERELFFIAAWNYRRHSICSMTTRGEHFTILRNLTGGYQNPSAIAVNTRQREVYVKSGHIVYKLNYTGNALRTIFTGEYSAGLSFDSVRNSFNLYFNDGIMLKKMSMSDEVVSYVATFNVKPSSLTYYNDTVYYGGFIGTELVGALQLGRRVVNTVLQTVRAGRNTNLLVSLVP